MNRFCNACDIKIDKINYLKHRTVCKNCHNKNRRKTSINVLIENQQHNSSENETCSSQHQPKIDINNPSASPYENHRSVIYGPSNVGKTFYKLKILAKISNKRSIHIMTKSPDQYPKCKTTNEIKIDKNKGSVVIFDDTLGARNSSQIDDFFTRGRHEN